MTNQEALDKINQVEERLDEIAKEYNDNEISFLSAVLFDVRYNLKRTIL